MTVIPPIKSQGIKTKLVDWIRDYTHHQDFDHWVEPFMGTGVVAFNIRPERALLCDSNPHLIRFYQSIQNGTLTASSARMHLTHEGTKLLNTNGEHYYTVRERFNASGNPLDFLFLSRSCFNGMMRFNKKGGFNVPFCRKPNRFAKALITKICNQISIVSQIIDCGQYEFKHQDFQVTLSETSQEDFVYCDPPYIGRHADYYNTWSEEEERQLHSSLMDRGAPFILSTWLKNRYRVNEFIFSLWGDCSIAIKEHYYFVGAKEQNRNAISEAILLNFSTENSNKVNDLRNEELFITV